MKKILIYGTGQYADIIYHMAHEVLQYEVAAFVLDKEYIADESYLNKPTVAMEQIKKVYPPDGHDMVIGFIGKEMFNQRKKKYELCHEMGYRMPNLIHPKAIIASNVKLGSGNVIFEHVSVGPYSILGSGNIFWNGCNIAHHANIGNYNNFAPGMATAGITTIGNNCFMGVNSATNNYVTIADYTLVGAGAYVSHDTKLYDVIVPAKSITLEGKKSTDFM